MDGDPGELHRAGLGKSMEKINFHGGIVLINALQVFLVIQSDLATHPVSTFSRQRHQPVQKR